MKKQILTLALGAMLVLPSCGGSSSSSSNSSDNSGDSPASKGQVVRRADGSVYQTGGYLAPKATPNAPKYQANINAADLPAKVDLRKFLSPVENQGQLGSCTANATAGAYEYLMWWHKQTQFDLSRLFLYYNSRAVNNKTNEDDGAMLYDVLQVLHDYGVCSEKTWPYVVQKFAQRPPDNCYEEAKNYGISKYEHVDLDLNTWKSVLAQGYPIIFAIYTYSNMQNPRNGYITVPRANEKQTGGHAMCCVGYSDPDRVFIVRNSWGHQWGDKGYCYIPYDYIMNPNLNYNDSWVIYSTSEPVDMDKIEEEAWDDDEESIFVDMQNEFSEMSDEDWDAMCDELGDYDIVFRLGALYNIAAWGDEEMSPAEQKLATEKLKKLLIMFGLDYSPKKVLKHCENIWVNEANDFFEKTVAILDKYLSEGARATIAADMLEICNADGDASDEERDLILGIVGDWLNADLIEAYYSDYLDEEEYDDYAEYDDEDDYAYYDDEDYDDEDYDDDDDYEE